MNFLIDGVPLDRFTPRLDDQVAIFVDRKTLLGRRTRVVVDQLVPNRAVNVVRSIR